MKFLSSSIFFFTGVYLCQFLVNFNGNRFFLVFCRENNSGRISAGWLIVPFALSAILFLMGIIEDRNKQ
jgi:hypothetical protein